MTAAAGARSKRTGLIATVAGALLVVSLHFTWWGRPAVFDDPPADLPPELEFYVEAVHDSGDPDDFATDAYRLFEYQDVVWLATGIAGFALGLALLTGPRPSRRQRLTGLLAATTLALAAVALAMAVAQLVSPPDVLELLAELSGGRPIETDADFSLSNEVGAFVGLASILGVGIGAPLAVRDTVRPMAR